MIGMRYTTPAIDDMAVIVDNSGIYVELTDGTVRVETPGVVVDVAEVVTDQFRVWDDSIQWNDLQAEPLHDEPQETMQ